MKKSIIISLAVLVSALAFISCGTTKIQAFPKMYEEDPLIMLIMPPINNSTAVDAKDYFYTTMTVPIAEAGYYVLPPAMTMATLQRESAYDSERFIDGDLSKFGQLFGADVAVFTIINSWNKSIIGSTITIELEYIFKSTKTNEVLFHRQAKIKCDTSTGMKGNGLLGTLLVATADAVRTAASDYVSVAVMCNETALSDIPYGKYHPAHKSDKEEAAMSKKISMSASK
ncbi:GNA1162 family protein [Treponema sp.]|jgi:hypothetical protein|uniref:GNA1162 family protein n=1 Tax=Treponema sp. TaxID=166 RepID=UPI0025E23A31|nr:GNA1162 family protein [Treponema sp.]MBR4322161.1 DUF799 family lipoprotein [Treponema sp.]